MANELQGMAGAIPRHPLNETLVSRSFGRQSIDVIVLPSGMLLVAMVCEFGGT